MSDAISLKQVKHLAKLASLAPSDSQLKTFQKNLTEIIDYMDQVKNMDLSKIPETARVLDEENVFREDQVNKARMFTQEEALANAKHTYNGYFVVDHILKNKE